MIKDIEEEGKTKFSIEVEFSFSFKDVERPNVERLPGKGGCGIIKSERLQPDK